MKKVLLFVAVVAAFSFASCKKDHVCTCTNSVNGVASSTPDVKTYTKSTKAAARANCLNGSQVNSGVSYSRTCTLN